MKRYFIILFLIPILSSCASVSYKKRVPLRRYQDIPTKFIEFDPYLWVCNITAQNNISLEFIYGSDTILVDGQFLNFEEPLYFSKNKVFIHPLIWERFFSQTPATYVYRGFKIEKVIIDPGHGGKDPGGIGYRGTYEKRIVLDVALRLKRILERNGIKVIMTRRKDVFVPLSKRVKISNESSAQLFLSIHANINRNRKIRGFEVYYYSPYPSGKYAQITQRLENSVLSYESTHPLSENTHLRNIIWDLVRTETKAESLRVAQYICNNVYKIGNMRIRGIKSANFFVLRNNLLPSLLIEIGYLSNPYEERLLNNPYFREQIAESIAEGIFNFNKEFEKIIVKK